MRQLLSSFAFNFNLCPYNEAMRLIAQTQTLEAQLPELEAREVGPGTYCSPRHLTHGGPSYLELNGIL